MNKIKECLIVVGDTANPVSMYENGYKFLSRCGMHFISLAEKLYSIYCNDILKTKPAPDEIPSLMQCNQSLVYNGEQHINNTNKAIIKYTINEGLKDYIELIAKNSHNFPAENITLDTIHPNYGREICKVLPYDCNSTSVGDYVNKTLSILNDWNHSDTTCSNSASVPLRADLWDYNVRDYVILGVAIVGGIGIGAYAGYCYWSRKSMKEDVFFYQQYLNCMDNLQAKKPQTQRIMESIGYKYLNMDVGKAEIRNGNLTTNKFYSPISGGTTSAAHEYSEVVDRLISNSVSSSTNCISNDHMLRTEIRDENLTTNKSYSPISGGTTSAAHEYSEVVDRLISNSVSSSTNCISNDHMLRTEIRDENLTTNYPNMHNMQPDVVYMEGHDAYIANHEENTCELAYYKPVDDAHL